MDDYFTIQTPSYLNNLFLELHNLQKHGLLCDVTLIAEDGEVQAHKIVLMAASKYFRDTLQPALGLNPTRVCLKGISVVELANVIQYIYTGKMLVSKQSMEIILEISEILGLTGLVQGYKDIITYEEMKKKQGGPAPVMPPSVAATVTVSDDGVDMAETIASISAAPTANEVPIPAPSVTAPAAPSAAHVRIPVVPPQPSMSSTAHPAVSSTHTIDFEATTTTTAQPSTAPATDQTQTNECVGTLYMVDDQNVPVPQVSEVVEVANTTVATDYNFDSLYDQQYVDVTAGSRTPLRNSPACGSVQRNSPACGSILKNSPAVANIALSKSPQKSTQSITPAYQSLVNKQSQHCIVDEQAQHQDLLTVAINTLSDAPYLKQQNQPELEKAIRSISDNDKADSVPTQALGKPNAENTVDDEIFVNGQTNTKTVVLSAGSVSNELGGKTDVYTVSLVPESLTKPIVMPRPKRVKTQKEKEAIEKAKMYRKKKAQLIQNEIQALLKEKARTGIKKEKVDGDKTMQQNPDFRYTSLSKTKQKMCIPKVIFTNKKPENLDTILKETPEKVFMHTLGKAPTPGHRATGGVQADLSDSEEGSGVDAMIANDMVNVMNQQKKRSVKHVVSEAAVETFEIDNGGNGDATVTRAGKRKHLPDERGELPERKVSKSGDAIIKHSDNLAFKISKKLLPDVKVKNHSKEEIKQLAEQVKLKENNAKVIEGLRKKLIETSTNTTGDTKKKSGGFFIVRKKLTDNKPSSQSVEAGSPQIQVEAIVHPVSSSTTATTSPLSTAATSVTSPSAAAKSTSSASGSISKEVKKGSNVTMTVTSKEDGIFVCPDKVCTFFTPSASILKTHHKTCHGSEITVEEEESEDVDITGEDDEEDDDDTDMNVDSNQDDDSVHTTYTLDSKGYFVCLSCPKTFKTLTLMRKHEAAVHSGRVRSSYTSKEKLAAVRYAEAHGNRAAGREFDVSESSIRDWRRQKDVLQRQKTTCKALRGRHALFPGVEKRLLEFIRTRRSQGFGVSTHELHKEAKKIANNESIPNFKASLSWVYKFLRRNNFIHRPRTHDAQKLPEDNKDTPFRCLECDYVAKVKSNLKTHMKLKHPVNENGIRKCQFCSYATIIMGNLKNHLLHAHGLIVMTNHLKHSHEKFNNFEDGSLVTLDGKQFDPETMTLPKNKPKAVTLKEKKVGQSDERMSLLKLPVNEFVSEVMKRHEKYLKKPEVTIPYMCKSIAKATEEPSFPQASPQIRNNHANKVYNMPKRKLMSPLQEVIQSYVLHELNDTSVPGADNEVVVSHDHPEVVVENAETGETNNVLTLSEQTDKNDGEEMIVINQNGKKTVVSSKDFYNTLHDSNRDTNQTLEVIAALLQAGEQIEIRETRSQLQQQQQNDLEVIEVDSDYVEIQNA